MHERDSRAGEVKNKEACWQKSELSITYRLHIRQNGMTNF